MTNKSGNIGTKTETAVCRYLTANGWPSAERRRLRGRDDAGDITGTPGICWSVKGGHAAENASDGQVAKWLDEAETQRVNANADVAILVLKRKGIGYERAGEWWAVMRLGVIGALLNPKSLFIGRGVVTPTRLHLADACMLLRFAGYGDRLEKDAS